MIHFTQGDMFGIPATHRINPVNCVGVMGAGVALLFKRKHPEMFADYQRECLSSLVRPGHFHSFTTPHYTIINFTTKRHFRDRTLLCDIEDGLIALRAWILSPPGSFKVHGLKTAPGNPIITMPALGCGHGGLDWETRVKPLIVQYLSDAPATIHAFAPTKWITNWFSNMLPCDQPFVYQGISFATVENFYQAMKMEKDNLAGRRALAAMQPHAAKKAVRDHSRFPWRADWNDQLALEIMKYALHQKFAPGTSWATKLIATRDEEIVEWNNWGDTKWGRDLKTGNGSNWLGKLLMEIRTEQIAEP